MTLPLCRVSWLGRLPYEEAWRLQGELAARRAVGLVPDILLLLEHPPVYTTGRRGPGNHLRIPPTALGAPLIESDRGGDITFHGPGQLVVYPILDLRASCLGVAEYVNRLEEAVIRTLTRYGIEGGREAGLPGVWVNGEKIAAIGVRVSRPVGSTGGWVTSHGLALNVDVDLDWFQHVVPCGLGDRGVTSVARLRGQVPALLEVAGELAARFGELFGRRISTGGAFRPSQAVLTGPGEGPTIGNSFHRTAGSYQR